MRDNPIPKRKRNRLEDFDYSSYGAYFVTVCVKDKQKLLWRSVGADIIRPHEKDFSYCLSERGRVVEEAIKNIPACYPLVEVNKYCIMPDHIHMIVFMKHENGRIISAPTLSRIIGQMKRWASKQAGVSLWQKSFYDTVIRDEQMYQEKWKYIDENPLKYVLLNNGEI